MVNRRQFIVSTILGGAGIATGCTARERVTGNPQNSREVPAFELDEFSAVELTRQMDSGTMTARSITELYVNRIAQLDTSGPELRAVIERAVIGAGPDSGGTGSRLLRNSGFSVVCYAAQDVPPFSMDVSH